MAAPRIQEVVMGGAVYQRGGNYAKLFERRRGVQSAYDGGGGGGGGGGVQSASRILY